MKDKLDVAGIPHDEIIAETALAAKGLVLYDPDGIALELYVILG